MEVDLQIPLLITLAFIVLALLRLLRYQRLRALQGLALPRAVHLL